MKMHIALLMIISLSLAVTHESAIAADSGRFEVAPVGAPFGTGKLVAEITLVVDGKEVTKKVTIEDIVAFKKPPQMPGEANKDYAQRIFEAQGEASQAKAKVIVDAINTEFNAEFLKVGDKAGTGLQVKKGKVRVGVVDYDVEAPFGAYVVPAVLKRKVRDKITGKEVEVAAVQVIEGRILGEGGNGGKFLKTPEPSSGMKGSLGRVDPNTATVSTGVDPFNDPSDVEVGIDEVYVAHYTPTAGQNDSDILAALVILLNLHGLPAHFDPIAMNLILDEPIPDGQTFIWGNTDTGLEFLTAFTPLDAAAPEPATLVLLLAGMLCLMAIARSANTNSGRKLFLLRTG